MKINFATKGVESAFLQQHFDITFKEPRRTIIRITSEQRKAKTPNHFLPQTNEEQRTYRQPIGTLIVGLEEKEQD